MSKRIRLTPKNISLDAFIAVTPSEVRAISKQQAAARMQRLLDIKAILERELGRESNR